MFHCSHTFTFTFSILGRQISPARLRAVCESDNFWSLAVPDPCRVAPPHQANGRTMKYNSWFGLRRFHFSRMHCRAWGRRRSTLYPRTSRRSTFSSNARARKFSLRPSKVALLPHGFRGVTVPVFSSHDWRLQKTSLVASWICSIVDDVKRWLK